VIILSATDFDVVENSSKSCRFVRREEAFRS